MFHSTVLSFYFLCRFYPTTLVLDAFNKSLEIERGTLLKPKVKDQSGDTKLFCLSTHNPLNPSLQRIIQKHWPKLERWSSTRPLVNYQIIYGKRRNENLSDMLVRAKLPSLDPTTPHGPPPCNNRRCTHCPRLNKTGTITSFTNKRTFSTKKKVTCCTYNLVYCMTCKLCGIQYVGETMNSIRDRFNAHNSTIRCRRDETVPRHFAMHGNTIKPDYSIHILEIIALPNSCAKAKELRLRKEQMWITKLNTLVPSGLNLDDQ